METIILISIIVTALIFLAIGFWIGKTLTDRDWLLNKVKQIREDAIKRSRAVLGGQFSEQLAPYLPDFPYSPTECRFLGKPIDLIVFKGMDEKDIQEVIFVEIKSSNSKLNKHETKLKEIIQNKKIKWQEYRIPKDITKKK